MNIRIGTPADIPQVLQLIRELADYERAANEVVITVDELREDGFGSNPLYKLFVAEEKNEIVGIALCYIRYSTWKGKMLYLEDLVVREKYRRKGIGRQLFDRVLELAVEQNYAGLIWQVLDWNEPAIEFYKKYNAEFSSEWITGKILLR